MSDEEPVRIIGLNVGEKAIGNKDNDENTVEGVQGRKFIDPDNLTIAPEEADLENIVEQNEHDDAVPKKKPFIFGSYYG